ncbi:MAG: GNAT family N-acetyltransferase [Propionibacteriaceae bacterium]
MPTIITRSYRPDDARATAEVYQTAIRTTAAHHYGHDQIEAWAGTDIDLERWNCNRIASWTIVAEVDGQVRGFSDLTPDGELDMLFVHPETGGQGLARRLVTDVLAEARRRGLSVVTTRASRAARPVFEHLGFIVDAENPHNIVRETVVPNFDMHINL